MLLTKALRLISKDNVAILFLYVISFLLGQLYLRIIFDLGQNMQDSGKVFIGLVVLIAYALNFSIILCRLYSVAINNTASLKKCFKQALKRCPTLMALNIIGFFVIGFLFSPMVILGTIKFPESLNAIIKICMFVFFLSLPVIMVLFVLIQEKKAISAIKSTLRLIFSGKISINSVLTLSIMYSLPFIILSVLSNYSAILGFIINTVWFLVCHSASVVLYSEITNKNDKNSSKNSDTTIVV